MKEGAQVKGELAEQESCDLAILPGGTEKILIAEDDDLVRRQTVISLKALGYFVTDARDGVEALEILRSGKRFDLLFTDVIMPRGINGRQLAEASAALCPDMPVLFTSGYAQDHMTHQGQLDPGLVLLSKPYSNRDLAIAVRKILDDIVGA